MRQVAQIMGMPITIDIPASDKKRPFEKVFRYFRDVDDRFSPYKSYSELSRFNRGELRAGELSSEMRSVIRACRRANEQTDGFFSAWYGKQFDPSGYVKGWSIRQAAKLIGQLGFGTFCISAGGDILAASDGAKKWRLGIQDPTDKTSVIEVLDIANGGVATSGNYERGAHIINPRTGQAATELLSLTVTGKDIVKADILATAGFARGRRAMENLNQNWPEYSAMAVSADGQILKTSGWPASHTPGSNP